MVLTKGELGAFGSGTHFLLSCSASGIGIETGTGTGSGTGIETWPRFK